MMPLLFAISFGGTLLLLFWGLLHTITVGALHRAVRRGALDPRPGWTFRAVGIGDLGVNPDATYRYLPFSLPPGRHAVVEGRVPEDVTYVSLTLYDPLLQSVEPDGPGAIVDPPTDPDGHFRVVLADRDPGVPWLDTSTVRAGILLERHLGQGPASPTLLRLLEPGEVPCR